jgi:hypothetical protein
MFGRDLIFLNENYDILHFVYKGNKKNKHNMIYLERKIPLFPKHFRIYFNFSLKNYSVLVKARINIC